MENKAEIQTQNGPLRAKFAAFLGGHTTASLYFWEDGSVLMGRYLHSERRLGGRFGSFCEWTTSVSVVKIHKFSQAELDACALAQNRHNAKVAQEDAARISTERDYALWLNAQPKVVDGWVINKSRGEIEYPNGEYYLPIPVKLISLKQYIKDNEYIQE